MKRLYVAKLEIDFLKGWNYEYSFSLSSVNGNFIKDYGNNSYIDENKGLEIPCSINCIEKDNKLVIYQGFGKDVLDIRLDRIESMMKEYLVNIVENYKNKYLKNYIKATIV